MIINNIINFYLVTSILGMLTVLYFRYLVQTDSNMLDKALLIFKSKDETKYNIKYPFMYFLIPILNVFLTGYLIWYIIASKEQIEKFIESCDKEKH